MRENLKTYRYNGVQFDIGYEDSFYLKPNGSKTVYKMNKREVYDGLLKLNRNALYQGVPVHFLLDCFADVEQAKVEYAELLKKYAHMMRK